MLRVPALILGAIMAKRTPEIVDLNKIELIQQVVCNAYDLRRFELLKRSNDGVSTEARQVGIYLTKRFTACTNEQIAKGFLYTQVNSVHQAVGSIGDRIRADDEFKAWVLSIAREFATLYKQNQPANSMKRKEK